MPLDCTKPSSGRFAANAAWLAVQVLAHNLARWTARIGLGEQVVTTKTVRRRFFFLAGRLTRSARRLTLHLPQRWPWENQVGLRASLAAYRPDNLAQNRHCKPSTSSLRGYRTPHPAESIGIKPSPSLSLASHTLSDRYGYIPSADSSLGFNGNPPLRLNHAGSRIVATDLH